MLFGNWDVQCAAQLCNSDGDSLTQKVIQGTMRRVARRANVKHGVHILRHTFCSHPAMRGAPTRAIQELAGHQDLGTTQRYAVRRDRGTGSSQTVRFKGVSTLARTIPNRRSEGSFCGSVGAAQSFPPFRSALRGIDASRFPFAAPIGASAGSERRQFRDDHGALHMDVTIPKSLEALVRRRVDEGHYSTEDEVVADALRLKLHA